MKKKIILLMVTIVMMFSLMVPAYADESESTIENTYAAAGPHGVKDIIFDSGEENYSQYRIWYPEDMEESQDSWPVVLVCNGTGSGFGEGMTDSQGYVKLFEHMASWGFIAIGNNDENSGTGDSTEKTLNYLLSLNGDSESIFYGKVDTGAIGLFGHSQGGACVINAATVCEHSSIYRALYAASVPARDVAEGMGYPYNPEKIQVPIFLTAGTGKIETGVIAPLESVTANYNDVESAVMTRLTGAEHGDMLNGGNGYMIAWFRYILCGDMEAAGAFVGESPELLSNQKWQDAAIKNLPSMHAHSFTTYISDNNATCVEDGTETAICDECGKATSTRTIVGSALGHEWDQGSVTKEPTAQEEGIQLYTCLRCGETRTETIPPNSENIDLPFTDVPGDAWYYDHVRYVYQNDLMVGISSTLFAPQQTADRAMSVTILYRLAGSPEVDGKNTFTDVMEDKWYTKPVIWASKNKIAIGFKDGSFGTNTPVTREQLATMLYRYAQHQGIDVSEKADIGCFCDKGSISDWAVDAVGWVLQNDIFVGVSKGDKMYFEPGKNASRCQVAAVIHRFAEKYTE